MLKIFFFPIIALLSWIFGFFIKNLCDKAFPLIVHNNDNDFFSINGARDTAAACIEYVIEYAFFSTMQAWESLRPEIF